VPDFLCVLRCVELNGSYHTEERTGNRALFENQTLTAVHSSGQRTGAARGERIKRGIDGGSGWGAEAGRREEDGCREERKKEERGGVRVEKLILTAASKCSRTTNDCWMVALVPS
jgi:hypothetical protein